MTPTKTRAAQPTTTISLIVPAAGKGVRAGFERNKILVEVAGEPLLRHTLRALLNPHSMPDGARAIELLVVARRDEWDEIETRVLQPLRAETPNAEYSVPLQMVEGGASRQESVRAGVEISRGDFVLVHDAARPLMSPKLCAKVAKMAMATNAAIAADEARDTIKIAAPRVLSDAESESPFIEKTWPRESVFLAQTPQVFRRDILRDALQAASRENYEGTDCASLVEKFGETRVALVCDGSMNLKVTRPDDFLVAEGFLSTQVRTR